MQWLRSMDGDKGFEAVRDNSGHCVDKHYGNASPLPCLSLDVALRVFYFHAERRCTEAAVSLRASISVHVMQHDLQTADVKRSAK
jgi:hypothetical protein